MGDNLTSVRNARSVAASLASREERETRLSSTLRCTLDDMRHTPEPILIVVATLIAALLIMGFAACTSMLYYGLNVMIARKGRWENLVEDEKETPLIEEVIDATDPINSYPHGSYIVVTPSPHPHIKNDRTLDELFSNSCPRNACLNADIFIQESDRTEDHHESQNKIPILRLDAELDRSDSHRRTLSDLSHGSSVPHQELKRSRLNSQTDDSKKACGSDVCLPGRTPALQSNSSLSDLCYSDDTSLEDLPDPADPLTHHSQNYHCSWSIVTQSGAKKANEEGRQGKTTALPVPVGNYYSHQYHLHDWDDISDLSSADGDPLIECHTPRTRTRSEITSSDDNASTPQPVLKRCRHDRSRSPVRPASLRNDPPPQRPQELHRRTSGHTDGENEQSSDVERAPSHTGPTHKNQKPLTRHQSDRLPTSSNHNEELPPRRAVSAPVKSTAQCPLEHPLEHPFKSPLDELASAARSPAGCTTSPHTSSVNNITIYNTPPHRPRSPPNVKIKGFEDMEVPEADVQLSSALCSLPSAPPLLTDSPFSSTKSVKGKSFWKSVKSWLPGSAPRKGATEVPNVDDTSIATAENNNISTGTGSTSNAATSSQYNNWDRLKVQLGVSVHNVFVGGLYEHESGRR